MTRDHLSVIDQQGWQPLAEKAAQDLPAALSATLFALAVDFVLADGRIAAAEEAVIERIRDILAIDSADAETVIAVLAAKNGIN